MERKVGPHKASIESDTNFDLRYKFEGKIHNASDDPLTTIWTGPIQAWSQADNQWLEFTTDIGPSDKSH